MKPNVVIIKSDQHNARCLGVNGHSQVKTPNLDVMASEGVNFSRAFVQAPICTPSRMCYLSGQYPHNHGHFGNVEEENANAPLPEGLPSLMSVFKSAGYRTGIVGHIHVKESWLRPSCDFYRSMHGPDNPYDAYLASKGLLHLRDDEQYEGRSQIKDGCPSKLSFRDSHEGYCLQSFTEFVDSRPEDRPFIFQIDTLHPHQNYIPAQEFWDMYEGADIELPPSADEDLSGKPGFQQKMLEERSHNYEWTFEPKTYEAGRLRKLHGYYGCISQVDHMVGEVRKALAERALSNNTIVVYCSDHGDFALEHGFIEKAPGISYDAILRVPFIWCRTGGDFLNGSEVEELVESIDLFPTLCALAGIDAPDTLDGQDISKMLRGDTTPVREFVVAEFPLSRTIRTKEWKLCHRPMGMHPEEDDSGEMYNVQADPWEMNNLYNDPQHQTIRETLRRRLFDWTLLNSRHPIIWPLAPAAEDGRISTVRLKEMLVAQEMSYYL